MNIVEKREISEVSTEVLTIKKDTKIASLNISSKRGFSSYWNELEIELYDNDIGCVVVTVKTVTVLQAENLTKIVDAVKVMNNI